jgi:SAM-dependent methyltransferase
MNFDTADDNPLLRFYESDHPWIDSDVASKATSEDPNLIKKDVYTYLEAAQGIKGKILDVCCGSGRVAVPMAKQGHDVVGIDISSTLLKKLEGHAASLPADVRKHLQWSHQDARNFKLKSKFDMALIAFNSLNCIGEFAGQLSTIACIANHLKPGGKLYLDIINPFTNQMHGVDKHRMMFERTNLENGLTYQRFMRATPMDADQCQQFHGWYDEIQQDGTLKRYPYSMRWRLIFKSEIMLMLGLHGFKIVRLEGDFDKRPYSLSSMRMVIAAEKTR